jgi:hypothetical protein
MTSIFLTLPPPSKEDRAPARCKWFLDVTSSLIKVRLSYIVSCFCSNIEFWLSYTQSIDARCWLFRVFAMKVISSIRCVCEELCSVLLPVFHRVAFLFNFVFEEAITISRVYYLLNFLFVIYVDCVSVCFVVNNSNRARGLNILAWQ